MGTAVPRQENRCRGTARRFTMSTGWTATNSPTDGDDQGLRALVVITAEGMGFELSRSLLGFPLFGGIRHGGEPIAARRFPCWRVVNARRQSCGGRRLPHDRDRRGMAIE